MNYAKTEKHLILLEDLDVKNGVLVTAILLLLFFLFPIRQVQAESFRAVVEGSVEVTPEKPEGSEISLGIYGAVFINLGKQTRFLKGVEIEVSAPQVWLRHRGSLVMYVYNNLTQVSASGIADLDGQCIAFEPLPDKLRIVYQIPVREGHGLRTTTVVTVPSAVAPVNTFPALFRLMPVIKGLPEELDTMRFNLIVRPILSDEGAVKLIVNYPPQLIGKPFTVLIDEVLLENFSEELVLKEGEHHLLILSEDYRNESRRFVVDRAKVLDLIIDLQDPTPLIIFEGPENAFIFLNDTPVTQTREPVAVEPGQHEAKFQVGDYTIIKTLNIQRGKTYRVAMEVDIDVQEME